MQSPLQPSGANRRAGCRLGSRNKVHSDQCVPAASPPTCHVIQGIVEALVAAGGGRGGVPHRRQVVASRG